ncbi:MAG: DNA-processing protein DprA, partial [Candidatus Thiodiazotropha sp.]
MDRISGTPPSDTEAWLLVGLASGIGSRYFQRLLDHYGDPQAILGASRRELAELGIPHAAIDNLLRQDRSRIESSLAWLAQPNHQLLTLGDEAYPPLLRQIDAPPPLLFLMGDKTLLLQPQLAIVGSRNPTTTGIDNAREFARCLAAAGI